MGVKDLIRSSEEFRRKQSQQTAADQNRNNDESGNQEATESVSFEEVESLFNAEKSDIEFWVQIAQLAILLLIWNELRKR